MLGKIVAPSLWALICALRIEQSPLPPQLFFRYQNIFSSHKLFLIRLYKFKKTKLFYMGFWGRWLNFILVETWGCVQRKTCAGVDYNSLYLIVNSVVSYATPLQRERSGVGKISPIGWAHLYLSANFQNRIFMSTQVQSRGRERDEHWELTLRLGIDIAWWIMENPMSEWL